MMIQTQLNRANDKLDARFTASSEYARNDVHAQRPDLPKPASTGTTLADKWLQGRVLATFIQFSSINSAAVARGVHSALWPGHLSMLVEPRAIAEVMQVRTPDVFMSKYLRILEATPVESGMEHQGKDVLWSFIQDRGDAARLEIAHLLSSLPAQRAASTLRLLGRIESLFTSHWRVSVVERALCHTDVGIRDAAIEAVEGWGDAQLRNVLAAHHDTVDWLAEYASQVVRDLTDESTNVPSAKD